MVRVRSSRPLRLSSTLKAILSSPAWSLASSLASGPGSSAGRWLEALPRDSVSRAAKSDSNSGSMWDKSRKAEASSSELLAASAASAWLEGPVASSRSSAGQPWGSPRLPVHSRPAG